MSGPWELEHHRGSAGAHHGREIPVPTRRTLWWFEVERPAVVLGSSQSEELVDATAARRAGVEIVRRRSGGGAVWLDPSSIVWVDVLLPVGDERWEADVGRAGRWLGEVWLEALSGLGVEGLRVHRGAMERDEVAELICFAGRADGEVLRGDRKVVGISARRTRAGARFQCSVLRAWEPEHLIDLLRLGRSERETILARSLGVAEGIGPIAPEEIVHALQRALGSG